jgi:UrcA family protein
MLRANNASGDTPVTRLNFARSALAVAAAALIAAVAAPALAQDKDKTTYDDPYYATSYDDEIIVIAPSGIHSETVGRTASGARIENVTTQRIVSTDDLDLRTDYGVNELRRRIHATVVDACRDIEASSPNIQITTRSDCVRAAERDAMTQADNLVYYVRG